MHMNLLVTTKAVLKDSIDYLGQISVAAYIQQIPILFGATIGQHTRHFIEFYQCLISQCSTPQVNYDMRTRDIKIESDPQRALLAIKTIIEDLPTCDWTKKIKLCSSIKPTGIQSNVERELLYNLEHTIHHLAMIRIGLQSLAPEIELHPNFGVAPSTVQHQHEIGLS